MMNFNEFIFIVLLLLTNANWCYRPRKYGQKQLTVE